MRVFHFRETRLNTHCCADDRSREKESFLLLVRRGISKASHVSQRRRRSRFPGIVSHPVAGKRAERRVERRRARGDRFESESSGRAWKKDELVSGFSRGSHTTRKDPDVAASTTTKTTRSMTTRKAGKSPEVNGNSKKRVGGVKGETGTVKGGSLGQMRCMPLPPLFLCHPRSYSQLSLFLSLSLSCPFVLSFSFNLSLSLPISVSFAGNTWPRVCTQTVWQEHARTHLIVRAHMYCTD